MNNREIDALIAEKVMGWSHVTTKRMADGSLTGQSPTMNEIDGFIDDVPHYTEDIATAMTVVEHIGDCLHLREHGEIGNWSAEFCGASEGESNADTASFAICLAALKFVGVEITKDIP